MKHRIFRLGLDALAASGGARLAARWTAGKGGILMFHHVRPYEPKAFEPNRILEITPAFLDAVISHTRALGYDIVPLSEVPDRLRRDGPRFAAVRADIRTLIGALTAQAGALLRS